MSGIDGGLRRLFRKNLPEYFWTSIETGGTGLGIPDSHYLLEGASGWIEYKQTDGHAVTLTEFQAAWLCRCARCGGRAWVAVRRHHTGGSRRGPPVDELYLFPGALAAAARAGGLREPRVAETCAREGMPWPGGPAHWPWAAVGALLAAPVRPLAAPSVRSSPRPAPRGAVPRRGTT